MNFKKLFFVTTIIFSGSVLRAAHVAQTQGESKRHTAASLSLAAGLQQDQPKKWSAGKSQPKIFDAGHEILQGRVNKLPRFDPLPADVREIITSFYPVDQNALRQCSSIQIHNTHDQDPTFATPIKTIKLSHNGALLATSDNTVYPMLRVFNTTTGQCVQKFPTEHSVSRIAFNHDSTKVVLSFEYGGLQLWDIRSKKPQCIRHTRVPHVYKDIIFTQDGKLLCLTEEELGTRRIALYNPDTDTEEVVYNEIQSPVKLHPNCTSVLCHEPGDMIRMADGHNALMYRLVERDLTTGDFIRIVCDLGVDYLTPNDVHNRCRIHFLNNNNTIRIYISRVAHIDTGTQDYQVLTVTDHHIAENYCTHSFTAIWEHGNGQLFAFVENTTRCTITNKPEIPPKSLPLLDLLHTEQNQMRQHPHILTAQELSVFKTLPQFTQTALRQAYPNLYLTKYDYYKNKFRKFLNHPTTKRIVNIAYHFGRIGLIHMLRPPQGRHPLKDFTIKDYASACLSPLIALSMPGPYRDMDQKLDSIIGGAIPTLFYVYTIWRSSRPLNNTKIS